ncbi:transcription-repair coupling factor [Castellaniella sp.]|uniref:transcription-repair coupling factor n=1 Tax=Castellaniella sp. TaxID=1955812 RepID=UPI003564FC76
MSSSTLTHDLPSVAPALAALRPGQRYRQPRPPGSGDALLLAQLAREAGRPLMVFSADPLQARRLADEISLFDAPLRLRFLPDWETLPYDSFSPHQDLISERLRTLHALGQGQVDVLIVPVTTALTRLAPPEFLAAWTFHFRQGEVLDEERLRAQLTRANYTHVTQVGAPGEFCIRGGLIDLFPMVSPLPYRIDLFDREIESIRSFDADTQRSLYPVREVELLPGREFPMDEEARNHFRARFRECFEGDPSRALPYRDIGNGVAFAGVEYYLPLFFEQTATLFDYLPEDGVAVTLGDMDGVIASFHEETRKRWLFLKSDPERPVLPPEQLFLDSEQFHRLLQPWPRLVLGGDAPHPDFAPCPPVAVNRRAEDPLAGLRAHLEQARSQGRRTIICVDSAGRRETIATLLEDYDLAHDALLEDWSACLHTEAALALWVAPLTGGFQLPANGLALLTENDLYPAQAGRPVRSRHHQAQHSDPDAMLRDLAELHVGDLVVHVQHGIGRYQGLVTMDMGEGPIELLHLAYAHDATLYVPVAQLHLIARYSGAEPEHVTLHALSSGQWEKAKRKAARQARDTAAELLALYAQRAAREGVKFTFPARDYQAFAEGFGFEETPDQAAAIQAVLEDMTSGRPMDRLVCGDVGFGKTEVALRAAFLAVMNGRQVALLCPTTLLAEQHAQNFATRFADWPVRIAELSRFRSGKETAQAIAGLADGTVDIVIGTHKILSKDVRFKQLGLVIVDEEHRFGVRQKEALKALRAEVDVLTLTATPIPRTLGMSLEGLRDFSVIATAPQKRLAIKTFVRREDGSTLREAILRELKRGGQVYFLHNEVDTIQNRRARLEELVPEARIAVAHGQMAERELEAVMKGFYQQRSNVLLCTTIIETGIDVPTANTILIHRADKLGLAQLHQLRGRVGRSHHQAYAYLLTPGEDAMTRNAKKRLEAIQAMEELGSGFFLAMHDLEIRGSGEVLGESQSGNMQEIGYSLYTEMLASAVRALKTGKEPDPDLASPNGCEINLHAPALLPSDYCADVQARLSFYKRLAGAREADELTRLHEELVDRYGSLPEAARTLIDLHRLRLQAEPLGITKIDAGDTQAALQFGPEPAVEPLRIIELVQKDRQVRLNGPDRLKLNYGGTVDVTGRVRKIRGLLEQLAA